MFFIQIGSTLKFDPLFKAANFDAPPPVTTPVQLTQKRVHPRDVA